MSCPYYWWNQNYACRKTGKEVSEDIYYKYCRNYDYSDCAIYQQKTSSDSSCYLTTACIKAKKLSDDCFELTTLRWFRDNYLMSFEQGKQDIEHYYEIAPKIVAAIERTQHSGTTFHYIYNEVVLPCVDLICNKQYEEAYKKYKGVALELEQRFL